VDRPVLLLQKSPAVDHLGRARDDGLRLPAAIGAHFARPDVPVFDVAGDGSIQMNIQELGTVSHNKIPVKIAVLNNMYLGMVRQWQELFYDRRYSFTELPPVDFVKIANAYGVDGYGSNLRRRSCLRSKRQSRPTAPSCWTSGSNGRRMSTRWSLRVLRSTR
jgi:glyoxylate carboligase